MIANLITSFVVHSETRTFHNDRTDVGDYTAIAAWMTYNIHLCMYVLEWQNTIAALFALGVWWVSVYRKTLIWRTRQRNTCHALMHFLGVLGTLVLLL